MSMIRRYPGTDYVTGIRAYAAMTVLAGHTGAFDEIQKFVVRLPDGVVMFFVVSGFSVAASFFKSASFVDYIVRRIARIWPIFFLAISAAFVCHHAGIRPPSPGMIKHQMDYSLYNYLMQISFLSFLDGRTSNSVEIGEWTIPVEVVWYFLLPLILLKAYDVKKLLICAMICVLAGAALKLGLKAGFGQLGIHAYVRSPVRWGAFFLMGVLAHYLRFAAPRVEPQKANALALLGLGVIVLATAIKSKISIEFLGAGVMLVIAYYRPEGLGRLRYFLEAKPVLFVGTISYSIYLTHMLMRDQVMPLIWTKSKLGFMPFVVTAALTLALSTVTYLFIERPMINVGGRLATKWGSRKPAALVVV
jgi:exopolysaccharide production protein ExoZ